MLSGVLRDKIRIIYFSFRIVITFFRKADPFFVSFLNIQRHVSVF